MVAGSRPPLEARMTRKACLARLREASPVILPSLLLCDFGNLEREVRRLEDAGAAALHLDVMDGHFVANFTYGFPIVEAVRRLTALPIDVHLMVAEPGRYLRQFYEAGADLLTIHIEGTPNPRPLLEEIRSLGAASGIALNPGTSFADLANCLDLCDLVLVMSVEAGFGGQKFNEIALEKLQEARKSHPELLLEVDGGVNGSTIARCAKAGAELFVVGSAIFGQPDYGAAVKKLRDLALQK